MTGALCVIGQGSSMQPLVAVLFQMAYLLLVLKTEPYEDYHDDWSAFVSSLVIVVLCLCGFALDASSDTFAGKHITNLMVTITIMSVIGQSIILIKAEVTARREMRQKASGKGQVTVNDTKVVPFGNQSGALPAKANSPTQRAETSWGTIPPPPGEGR